MNKTHILMSRGLFSVRFCICYFFNMIQSFLILCCNHFPFHKYGTFREYGSLKFHLSNKLPKYRILVFRRTFSTECQIKRDGSKHRIPNLTILQHAIPPVAIFCLLQLHQVNSQHKKELQSMTTNITQMLIFCKLYLRFCTQTDYRLHQIFLES